MLRECGDCQVCCIYPSIEGVKKAGERCCFLKEGCSIYATRFKECVEYNCAWKQGYGAVQDRPDKSGVLVDERDSQFGDVLIARSASPGSLAIETRAGKKAIHRIQRDSGMKLLITADDDNERIIGYSGN